MRKLISRTIATAAITAAAAVPVTVAAGAAAYAEAGSSRLLIECGYNDNVNGRAIWRNCDASKDYIRTTALGVSTSYQCVPAETNYDLGPTWFISSSVLIGTC
ncbi:hypothetical protein [Nonomuraea diastatica]|uniref:Uncharacterized protein n=1 Tax=Nonomuraea diastatica TaxID=1848329 RepID=A0A4R4WFM7_9ACTN|nr:hypothetical protein [Nonomuraea diastatica]TDD15004.1 hypothetical protein E1294_35820 [Nonomuraea diastatica]